VLLYVIDVRLIVSDAQSYITVATQLWGGRELHTFTRKELEIYLDVSDHGYSKSN